MRCANGRYFGPRLVLSSWFDGGTSEHVRQLCSAIPELLEAAFRHCEGFSGSSSQPFLYAHAVRSKAAYNSARLRSAQQIRAEAGLARALQQRAEQLPARTPDALFDELLNDARKDQALAWAFAPPARFHLTGGEKAQRWLSWLLRTAPRWLMFFASLRALRECEKEQQRARTRAANGTPALTPPDQAARDSTSNAYNSISFVLPGGARQRALTLFLDLLQTVGAQRTDLSGITSMRFAHWCTIDNDARLLFCSMYDGAWESYMADFVHLAGWGLTGVWSNTESYPDTDYLVLNGARDEQGFRRFVREREVETAFWFRAYPGVSGENIQDNSAIRAGLSRPLDQPQRAAWLSLL